jgi:hypothetical protein
VSDEEYELTLLDPQVDVLQRWARGGLVLLADLVQGDHHGTSGPDYSPLGQMFGEDALRGVVN